MKNCDNTSIVSRGVLDTVAVSMSLLCAIHCLITPVLLVALPILATSFWVNKNFHLWMLALVIPTTIISVMQGCKKHKDKWVASLASIGLATLLGVALYESFVHQSQMIETAAHCNGCVQGDGGMPFTATIVANLLGGIFLASAHIRNFILCRKAHCCH